MSGLRHSPIKEGPAAEPLRRDGAHRCPSQPAQRAGPCEILAPLGAGGMGTMRAPSLHGRNLPKPSASRDDQAAAFLPQVRINTMPPKFVDVLMLGRCLHEFSWPRRGSDGDYYQVCLLCAAEYKYDWKTMRRTGRIEHAIPETGIRRSHPRQKRPSWVPRARRIKLEIPIRYRINKTSSWYEGTIENISQSGLLFLGPQRLPVNALIEVVFCMPKEISGHKDSNVVCQGRVLRAKALSETDDKFTLAASIIDYKFIH
jgi:hypothetical protein